jgi:predicted RND superfamily exporter protein
LLTITVIPAYIVSMDERRLANLRRASPGDGRRTLLGRFLAAMGPLTLRAAKPVVAVAALLAVVSAVGISRITINDNPVRWFRADHKIRVADRVLNEHFAGTYSAFLVLRGQEGGEQEVASLLGDVGAFLTTAAQAGAPDLGPAWAELSASALADPEVAYEILADEILWKLDDSSDAEAVLWEGALERVESAESSSLVFQDPEVLAYVERLQEALLASGLVGKSTGVTDIVKTVHRELRQGDEQYFSVPENSAAVSQTLLSYQSSHRPDDLWHFVTPDFRSANLWLQLTSGDNQHMVRVTEVVDRYAEKNPPPAGLSLQWAGLTYLNVVWQQDMVSGMLRSLLGGFVIVFLMMLVLFRSPAFAALAMLPLSVTIGFIYGVFGLTGKDYDMPVAVLSALTLGLSIDFAIHFLQRARESWERAGDMEGTMNEVFGPPVRAILRNVFVISLGFVPMFFASLVP